MLDQIKYRKPPIVEVVCEFRFVPSEPWDATVIGPVYVQLKDTFPKRRTLGNLVAEVVAGQGGVHQQIQLGERVQFLREDEQAFAQVGPNLLAVNHLAPYPTWEVFSPLIQQAYQAYRDAAKPAGLQRIGLRYINRLEFPDKTIEFSNYLNFYPFTGTGLPALLYAFNIGAQFPFEDERDLLRLQLSNAEPTDAGNVTALLDLDYFLARPQAIEPDQAFDWLQQAHGHVQSVFEACVTDRLKTTFDPLTR